ncbi:MAG: MFS transporter [Verrucomicrobia bacterium]|nr:MFS transporter [Verrucomicrobiota bacterium]MBU6446240.1 MFS transporter [Verrucomicrobiota bacterium]MDE3047164.1 MFS transporter [Verrucomicrobiota bacterium]
MMHWPIRSDFRSFYFLNATQFLGALNDNLFKLLVIYLLINVKGTSEANSILSIVGAVFVIPFLLFSSGAGVLADRMSKRTIIVYTKALELVIVLFAFLAVALQWEIGSYAALFLMATQSAIFGPSKYGIIPELVEAKKVSKANGSLTSMTFLAIISGTFLASFITHVTGKNFVFEAGVCVVIAILGVATSFGIARTHPQQSTKKINPIFIYEIYQTLKTCWKIPHLLPAIYGSSFFLFIGSFTQLNIIPFAMESLGLSEVGGGFLFLPTAIGIAIGAFLAGQLSKDRVEPGISCICGFFIALFFFLLYFFSTSMPLVIITLGLLGIFGGAYLIPFDAFLQVSSPDEKRGQIIAAANFFSFVGVLMASLALYLLSVELKLSAASGFAWMGILTLVSNSITTGRLSSLFFPFFVNKILKRFRRLKLASPVPPASTVIILRSNSWYDALLLYSCLPRLKILVPGQAFRHFPWANWLLESIQIVSPEPNIRATLKTLFRQAKRFQGQNSSVCLFFHRREDSPEIIDAYNKVFDQLNFPVLYAHGNKERIKKRFLFFRYTQKQITLSFSKE